MKPQINLVLAIVLLLFFVGESFHSDGGSIKTLVFPNNNTTRKLLQSDFLPPPDGGGNRNGASCSKADIMIYQDSISPLPSGIPAFRVEIVSMSASGCGISNIHVKCGWFSSVYLIRPSVFKRLQYDDCLVNGGRPLPSGQVISFQYANSFRYPLSVSSVACC